MMMINKLILTIIVLTTYLLSSTTATPLEFYISLKECPDLNITNTLGSCTTIEGCNDNLKSVLSVEKFENNYEGRFFSNNDCKGFLSKKTIWFECVEGGSEGNGYLVYCDQYPNVPTNSSSVENTIKEDDDFNSGSGSFISSLSSSLSSLSSFSTSSTSSTTNQVTTSSTTTGQPITTSSSSSGTFSSVSSSSTGFIPSTSNNNNINIRLN